MPKHLTKIDVVGALPPDPTVFEDGYPVFLSTDETLYFARPNLATPAWVPHATGGGGGGGGGFTATSQIIVEQNTGLSVSHNTHTPANLDTIQTNNGGSDLSVDLATDRVNILTTGVYRMSIYAVWAANATGYRKATFGTGISIPLDYNGGPESVVPNFGASMSTSQTLFVGAILLEAGGYIQPRFLQDSGAALSLDYVGLDVVRMA